MLVDTYFLSRLPAGVGLFLGLTGARVSSHDAASLGLADGIVRSEKRERSRRTIASQLESGCSKEQTDTARLSCFCRRTRSSQ